MNKVDESKKMQVVIGLENATMEQRLVFQSIILPDILKVLDTYADLFVNASDMIKVTTKPVEEK